VGITTEKEPQLSPEELESLWADYKKIGDVNAKHCILLHYNYLVKWIVRRVMPKYSEYSEYDDLVSCGILGLIDAVDKFQLKHNVKFETYASLRIRGEILDYMREQDWAPPSLRSKITAINKAFEKFENKNGISATEQEVADSLNMQLEQVQEILAQAHMFNLMNFEDTLDTINYSFRGQEESTPEDELLLQEQKERITEAIDLLPERERLAVTLYYYEGLLLKEIGNILNVSESRVSQMLSKALLKMRRALKNDV